jgi:predicted thioesterase
MKGITLTPGAKGSAELIVGTEHTAPHVGSGKIAVLATPVMVNLMEAAALAAVEKHLPAGYQTLELSKVDGRRLTFRVFAEDEKELIGEGTHQRVIVNVERFDRRIQDKAEAKS